MRICVLSDPNWDEPFDPAPYLSGHEWEIVEIHKATAVQEIRAIAQRDFDVVFNLCDGAWDEASPGIEVVQALERFNVPFTGANSRFFEPSREAMKRVCRFWDVRTPLGVFVDDLSKLKKAVEGMRYPLLAKHPCSYASIGLKRDSRVMDFHSLYTQAERMIQAFGSTLIEEFIDGREFSVLVAENPNDPFHPKVYEPVEFLFPEGELFKHEHLKWIDYARMKCRLVETRPLAVRLKEMAEKLFVGLNGVGYGRCDLRMNEQGELFMLEINPNCAVFYSPQDPGSADYILQNDPGGHQAFVDLILRSALTNHQRRQSKWDVRFDADLGYGLYANVTFEPGDVVVAMEEQSRVLVSRSRVLETWNEERIEHFFRHAYPLSEETWVMWNEDPSQWKPINHSCDPNAWLEGLNIVARREIQPGEQITLDYATFYSDEMPAFECQCGSVDCRGLIQGSDYLQPFVADYGEHVSEYVRIRRAVEKLPAKVR